MKLKSLLFGAAMLLGATASNAKVDTSAWTIPNPMPEPETTAFVADGATKQYLYNVEAKAFLRGANDWKTRATLDTLNGYKWKIYPQGTTPETYSFADSLEIGSVAGPDSEGWGRMFADGNEGIWVDNVNGANAKSWTITAVGGNNFTISNTAFSEYVLGGVKGNIGTVGTNTATVVGTYVNLYAPDKEDFQYTWAAVSEAAYEQFHAPIKAYQAAQALATAINDAEDNYPGIDLSAEEAVYNNSASTAAELNAATAKVAEDIEAYINSKADNASLANPVEVTSQIMNGDVCSAVANWNQKFTGSGTVGALALNTWSVEGSSDGTNVLTPFIQTWASAGNLLSDQINSIDTIKVKPGIYKITGTVRLYNESGATSISGPSFFGNFWKKNIVDESKEVSTDVSNGEEGYFTYNNMLGYFAPEANTYAIVGNDSTLTFGIMVKDANYNWHAHKNYRIYYCGANESEVSSALEGTECTVSIDDDAIITTSIKDDFNQTVEAIAQPTIAGLADAVKAYKEKLPLVEANEAAWTTYQEQIVKINNLLGDGSSIDDTNEAVMKLSDIRDNNETVISDLELTTEELNKLNSDIDSLIEESKKALKKGANMNDYLVNPAFSNGTTGWSGKPSVSSSCGEKYGTGAFDVYQEVKGLPVGVYEISMQGFYRQYRDDDNGKTAWYNYFDDSATEDDADYAYRKKSPAPDTLAYVYLNDMKTALQCVYDFKQDYTYDETTGSGSCDFYGSGYSVDPHNKYAYPNTMANAAAAFAVDAYKVKAYGIVAKEGDVMRIGVKGDLTPGGLSNNWAIFDNFNLTYQAKDPDLINMLLPQAKNAINFSNVFGKEVREDALSNIAKVETAATNDEKFQALADVYAAASKVEASTALFDTLATKNAELEAALGTYQETASDEVQDAAGQLNGEIAEQLEAGDAIEYTNDDARAKIAEIEDMIKKLAIPADIKNASEENPADLTAFLVNPSFETGDFTGWTQTGLQTQSNTAFGKDGTYYCEKWHVSAALDVHQTVDMSEIPYGTYKITADDYCDAVVAGTIYAVVGEDSVSTLFSNNTSATSPATDAVEIYVPEGQNLKIGACGTLTTSTWFTIDNFKLYCVGYHKDVTAVRDVQEVSAATKKNSKKFVENGQVVIYKNNKKYSILGVELK